jgi:hypothetical protein
MRGGRVEAGRIGTYVIVAVAVGLYAGTGHLIISRLRGNATGWRLCLIGLLLAVTMLSKQYALYGLATKPGSMPAARLAGWFSEATALLTVTALFFLVLLVPDGGLPSRRWRPLRWAMFVVAAARWWRSSRPARPCSLARRSARPVSAEVTIGGCGRSR